MLHLQTNTQTYWTSDFKLTQDDFEFIYNLFLDEETPLKTPDLIERLIGYRIENEFRQLKKYKNSGEFFQPSKTYSIGQEVIFPAFNFLKGTVLAQREGYNPDYGPFSVLEVEFEDGHRRNLASRLDKPHKLDQDMSDLLETQRPDPHQIYQRHKQSLTRTVVDALREDADMIFIAKRWFLKSLLMEVNMGHLNLAEAVLDMEGGGPLKTQDVMDVVGFGGSENPILRTFSFDYSLSLDNRFDEVGPAGQVLWFLRRMEPAEILEVPRLLRYHEINYDPNALTDELLELEEALDDEHDLHELVDDEDLDDEATITLIYPHLRMGTLPLTPKAEHLFPIAYRTPRILITLVDTQTQNEMRGWVVRDSGYVVGLKAFYQTHDLPIGALLKIRPDEDDPSRIEISYEHHRPRSEWIWVASVVDDKIRFSEAQHSIGALYDDTMLLGVENPDALDKAIERFNKTALPQLMLELAGELAQFSPQRHVHCKTLYSAVNLLRRCPPGPIFATLCTHPAFSHAGGAYWRLT